MTVNNNNNKDKGTLLDEFFFRDVLLIPLLLFILNQVISTYGNGFIMPILIIVLLILKSSYLDRKFNLRNISWYKKFDSSIPFLYGISFMFLYLSAIKEESVVSLIPESAYIILNKWWVKILFFISIIIICYSLNRLIDYMKNHNQLKNKNRELLNEKNDLLNERKDLYILNERLSSQIKDLDAKILTLKKEVAQLTQEKCKYADCEKQLIIKDLTNYARGTNGK